MESSDHSNEQAAAEPDQPQTSEHALNEVEGEKPSQASSGLALSVQKVDQSPSQYDAAQEAMMEMDDQSEVLDKQSSEEQDKKEVQVIESLTDEESSSAVQDSRKPVSMPEESGPPSLSKDPTSKEQTSFLKDSKQASSSQQLQKPSSSDQPSGSYAEEQNDKTPELQSEKHETHGLDDMCTEELDRQLEANLAQQEDLRREQESHLAHFMEDIKPRERNFSSQIEVKPMHLSGEQEVIENFVSQQQQKKELNRGQRKPWKPTPKKKPEAILPKRGVTISPNASTQLLNDQEKLAESRAVLQKYFEDKSSPMSKPRKPQLGLKKSDLKQPNLEPKCVEDARDYTVLSLLKVDEPEKYIKQDQQLTKLGYSSSRNIIKNRRKTVFLPRMPSKEQLISRRKLSPYLQKDVRNFSGITVRSPKKAVDETRFLTFYHSKVNLNVQSSEPAQQAQTSRNFESTATLNKHRQLPPLQKEEVTQAWKGGSLNQLQINILSRFARTRIMIEKEAGHRPQIIKTTPVHERFPDFLSDGFKNYPSRFAQTDIKLEPLQNNYLEKTMPASIQPGLASTKMLHTEVSVVNLAKPQTPPKKELVKRVQAREVELPFKELRLMCMIEGIARGDIVDHLKVKNRVGVVLTSQVDAALLVAFKNFTKKETTAMARFLTQPEKDEMVPKDCGINEVLVKERLRKTIQSYESWTKDPEHAQKLEKKFRNLVKSKVKDFLMDLSFVDENSDGFLNFEKIKACWSVYGMPELNENMREYLEFMAMNTNKSLRSVEYKTLFEPFLPIVKPKSKAKVEVEESEKYSEPQSSTEKYSEEVSEPPSKAPTASEKYSDLDNFSEIPKSKKSEEEDYSEVESKKSSEKYSSAKPSKKSSIYSSQVKKSQADSIKSVPLTAEEKSGRSKPQRLDQFTDNGESIGSSVFSSNKEKSPKSSKDGSGSKKSNKSSAKQQTDGQSKKSKMTTLKSDKQSLTHSKAQLSLQSPSNKPLESLKSKTPQEVSDKKAKSQLQSLKTKPKSPKQLSDRKSFIVSEDQYSQAFNEVNLKEIQSHRQADDRKMSVTQTKLKTKDEDLVSSVKDSHLPTEQNVDEKKSSKKSKKHSAQEKPATGSKKLPSLKEQLSDKKSIKVTELESVKESAEKSGAGSDKPAESARVSAKPLESIKGSVKPLQSMKGLDSEKGSIKQSAKPLQSIKGSEKPGSIKPLESIKGSVKLSEKQPLGSLKGSIKVSEKVLNSIKASENEHLESVKGSIKASEKPLESIKGSVKVSEKPLESMKGSVKDSSKPLESMKGSVKVSEKPLESVKGSNKDSSKPIESMKGSFKVSEKPLESMKGSIKASEKPLESAKGSVKVSEKPLESVKGSIKASEKPLESMKGSVQVSEKPLDSVKGSVKASEKSALKSIKGSEKPFDALSIKVSEKPNVSVKGSAKASEKPIQSIKGSIKASEKPNMESQKGSIKGSQKPLESVKASEKRLESIKGSVRGSEKDFESVKGSIKASEKPLQSVKGSVKASEKRLESVEGQDLQQVSVRGTPKASERSVQKSIKESEKPELSAKGSQKSALKSIKGSEKPLQSQKESSKPPVTPLQSVQGSVIGSVKISVRQPDVRTSGNASFKQLAENLKSLDGSQADKTSIKISNLGSVKPQPFESEQVRLQSAEPTRIEQQSNQSVKVVEKSVKNNSSAHDASEKYSEWGNSAKAETVKASEEAASNKPGSVKAYAKDAEEQQSAKSSVKVVLEQLKSVKAESVKSARSSVKVSVKNAEIKDEVKSVKEEKPESVKSQQAKSEKGSVKASEKNAEEVKSVKSAVSVKNKEEVQPEIASIKQHFESEKGSVKSSVKNLDKIHLEDQLDKTSVNASAKPDPDTQGASLAKKSSNQLAVKSQDDLGDQSAEQAPVMPYMENLAKEFSVKESVIFSSQHVRGSANSSESGKMSIKVSEPSIEVKQTSIKSEKPSENYSEDGFDQSLQPEEEIKSAKSVKSKKNEKVEAQLKLPEAKDQGSQNGKNQVDVQSVKSDEYNYYAELPSPKPTSRRPTRKLTRSDAVIFSEPNSAKEEKVENNIKEESVLAETPKIIDMPDSVPEPAEKLEEEVKPDSDENYSDDEMCIVIEQEEQEIKPALDLGDDATLVQDQEGAQEVEEGDTLNDFKDLYEIGEPLSQETYVHATTYLCTEKATGDAKQVLRFEDNKLSSQNESKNLLYDCMLLQQLVHDNIVKTFNFFEKEVDDGECTHYWIVMEPMNQCKQLLDQIEKQDCYREADAASVIKTMLGAISYVHGKGQAHGDLRPQNIWVPQSEEKFSGLKLNGFSGDQSNSKNLRFGSADFLAPDDSGNRQKADMWSIGVLTYLLLSGNQLAADKSDKEVRDTIKRGDFKIDGLELVSEPGKDFIKKLLTTDPEARCSAADALAHPWLSSEFAATELPEAHLRLKSYRRMMQFRYMTYVYLTQHLLSPFEVLKLLKVFKAIDINNDNQISVDEIRKGYCKNMGKVLSEEELTQWFREADIDNSGTLDWNEFAIEAGERDKKKSATNLQLAFQMLDDQGTGNIPLDKIKSTLSTFCDDIRNAGSDDASETVLAGLIAVFDTNQDGQIDFSEFTNIMKSLTTVTKLQKQKEVEPQPVSKKIEEVKEVKQESDDGYSEDDFEKSQVDEKSVKKEEGIEDEYNF